MSEQVIVCFIINAFRPGRGFSGLVGSTYEPALTKGGDEMVLTLYHDDKEPYKVFNVIKVTVDNQRTIIATVKHGVHIEKLSYHFGTGYQRLTVQLD